MKDVFGKVLIPVIGMEGNDGEFYTMKMGELEGRAFVFLGAKFGVDAFNVLNQCSGIKGMGCAFAGGEEGAEIPNREIGGEYLFEFKTGGIFREGFEEFEGFEFFGVAGIEFTVEGTKGFWRDLSAFGFGEGEERIGVFFREVTIEKVVIELFNISIYPEGCSPERIAIGAGFKHRSKGIGGFCEGLEEELEVFHRFTKGFCSVFAGVVEVNAVIATEGKEEFVVRGFSIILKVKAFFCLEIFNLKEGSEGLDVLTFFLLEVVLEPGRPRTRREELHGTIEDEGKRLGFSRGRFVKLSEHMCVSFLSGCAGRGFNT